MDACPSETGVPMATSSPVLTRAQVLGFWSRAWTIVSMSGLSASSDSGIFPTSIVKPEVVHGRVGLFFSVHYCVWELMGVKTATME
jgi:hypothetical protein